MDTTQTEKKILKAANKIFRNKGMDGARMQDIADEAGINKALLHYYFRSKELLFERIFRDNAAAFFDSVNEILCADKDLFEKIELLCHNYIDLYTKNPNIPIFINGEINKKGSGFIKRIFSGGLLKPDYSIMKAQIEKEIKNGRIKNIKPELLFVNILSLCLFPLVAKPMMQITLGITEQEFQEMLEERKKLVPAMIIENITKK
jgi:AcrR family transcriptional regulator